MCIRAVDVRAFIKCLFFFNDTATTEIYTLSLHDALPISRRGEVGVTEETTAFADAMIFDGVSAELREGCVRVAAGTIAEVAEGPEPGDRVIDCRGRTVVPGLIDAHFHAYGARLSLMEIETSPLSYLALAGARRLAGALGRGFTTVRDPGGGDAGLAREIREGP